MTGGRATGRRASASESELDDGARRARARARRAGGARAPPGSLLFWHTEMLSTYTRLTLTLIARDVLRELVSKV